MILMKFGGASLGSAEKIERAHGVVQRTSGDVALVVSALDGTTDRLLEAAYRARKGTVDSGPVRRVHETILGDLGLDLSLVGRPLADLDHWLRKAARQRKLDPVTLDAILSVGERSAALAVAAAFRRLGTSATSVDTSRNGLTIRRTARRTVCPRSLARFPRLLDETRGIPVITGYIGRDSRGRPATLGRNGSDYSASLFGRSLDAKEIRIYKEVDGILSADPGQSGSARVLPSVSYRFARTLTALGSPVLDPRSIGPAAAGRIPLRVLNPREHRGPGTLISAKSGADAHRSVVVRRRPHLVELRGPLAAIPPGRLMALFGRGIELILKRRGRTVVVLARKESATRESEPKPRDLVLVTQEPSSGEMGRWGRKGFEPHDATGRRIAAVAYVVDPEETSGLLATL